jgi:hypothetical protein
LLPSPNFSFLFYLLLLSPQSISDTMASLEALDAAPLELKENTVIVVLGASGDLAKKKTYPALFGLVGYPRKPDSPSIGDGVRRGVG